MKIKKMEILFLEICEIYENYENREILENYEIERFYPIS